VEVTLNKPVKQVELPDVTFRDGTKLGEPIPGSRFVRSICDVCSELIRVTQASTCDFCLDCDPREPMFREPRIAMTREMADQKHLMLAATE